MDRQRAVNALTVSPSTTRTTDSAAALSEYDAGFGAVGGDEWGDDGLSECISDFGFGFAGGDEWDDDDFLTQILASERTPEEWGRAWAQREGRLC